MWNLYAIWHDCCTSRVVDGWHQMGTLIYIFFNTNMVRLPSKKTNINNSYHQTGATSIFPGGYCTKKSIFRLENLIHQAWCSISCTSHPSLSTGHVTVFSMGDSDLFRACRPNLGTEVTHGQLILVVIFRWCHLQIALWFLKVLVEDSIISCTSIWICVNIDIIYIYVYYTGIIHLLEARNISLLSFGMVMQDTPSSEE